MRRRAQEKGKTKVTDPVVALPTTRVEVPLVLKLVVEVEAECRPVFSITEAMDFPPVGEERERKQGWKKLKL